MVRGKLNRFIKLVPGPKETANLRQELECLDQAVLRKSVQKLYDEDNSRGTTQQQGTDDMPTIAQAKEPPK